MSAQHRPVLVSPTAAAPYGQAASVGAHVLSMDEPQAVGGQDTGPDPFELVMAGLGACTAMTLRMYADGHGWPLERVDVEVRHVDWEGVDRIKGHRFERTLRLQGALSAEQRARLVEVADRCPVSKMLKQGAMVTAAEAAAEPAL